MKGETKRRLFNAITPNTTHKFLLHSIQRTGIDFGIFTHMFLVVHPVWISILICALLLFNGYTPSFFEFLIIYVLSIYLWIWYTIGTYYIRVLNEKSLLDD